MKTISLTQDKFALVDDTDFEWLSQWKWWFYGNYVAREKKSKKIYLHRQIMGFPSRSVDHINRDKLDNRRTNLRVVSTRTNTLNAGMRKNNTSGHKGLIWCKGENRWKAEIYIYGKSITRYSKDKNTAIKKLQLLRSQYYGKLA